MKKNFFIFFLLLSSLSFSKEAIISVMGKGSVKEKPDTFEVIAVVETQGKDSKVVIDENTKIVNSTLDNLFKQGLNKDEIKVTDYTLDQRRDYTDNKELKYFASNYILIKTDKITEAGKILQTLNESSVQNIRNVSFSISNTKELEKKAYQLAYNDAKEKAMAVAELEKLTVSPKDINFEYTHSVSPQMLKQLSVADSNSNSVPITIAENVEISATVRATFYLQK